MLTPDQIAGIKADPTSATPEEIMDLCDMASGDAGEPGEGETGGMSATSPGMPPQRPGDDRANFKGTPMMR